MVSTAGGIVIAIVVVLVVAAIGWVVFSQLRARRLGVSFFLLLLLILPVPLLCFCLERQAMFPRRKALFGSDGRATTWQQPRSNRMTLANKWQSAAPTARRIVIPTMA